MTPSLIIRPVLACLAAATLSACGMVDADPHRFENMAEAVAAIPLDGQAEHVDVRAPAARTAAEAGLRPALKVEVMDPHALWDARDGGLRGMAEEQGQRFAAAAAPAVADAVVRNVSTRIDAAAAQAGLRPARAPRSAPAPAGGKLVQIGAYSSEAAARAAWARLDLDGLTPVFEAAEVGGRRLTRLKVNAPASGAAAVCAAAGIDDPWCHRAA
ncbi:SPOR domain-containing protein [Roseibacterium beibuensis]|uniref:SPOR domain-containing protein n=1 Tax=[Roseibacterium] beibuensis TaxID=1193142 RepID=UPI00217E729C|nr:SPOR domain-containing protein [Roseibacterium beibuensis]MCS6625028.1 SPOR domain-containing protein [Roseibacterium beibuensis]